MSKQPGIPPMLKDLIGNGHAAQPVRLVTEETLHSCSFGFLHLQGPNGQVVWALTFDTPLGPGFASRITVPFDTASIEKFEAQLRAWRAGIDIPS